MRIEALLKYLKEMEGQQAENFDLVSARSMLNTACVGRTFTDKKRLHVPCARGRKKR